MKFAIDIFDDKLLSFIFIICFSIVAIGMIFYIKKLLDDDTHNTMDAAVVEVCNEQYYSINTSGDR